MSETTQSEAKHPIQVVAKRTGLSPDVLRAWERRYAAVSPQRTAKNRRLYSDEDVERLRLLRRATIAGRRIGDVSRLSRKELESLVAVDEAEAASVPRAARPKRGAVSDHLQTALAAVEQLDAQALASILSGAAVTLSPPLLVEELLAPLLHEVGNRWRNGSLRAAHEHLATSVVRSFLSTLAPAAISSEATGEIIVTTPSGQHHEMGALVVAVSLAMDGWRVTYLGPNLPAEEIAAAAHQKRARVVALSIVFPVDDPHLVSELTRLRHLLDENMVIVVGGPGAPAYRRALDQPGVALIEDIARLRTELQDLRSAP